MKVALAQHRTSSHPRLTAVLFLVALVESGDCVATSQARSLWAGDPEASRYEPFWPMSPFLTPAGRGRSPSEEWLVVGDHQIHLDRMPGTPSTATTVIMVHGGAGNGRLLLPFAIPLWERGFEVVAPDLPNYGRSIPGAEPITFDMWVRILSALVDQEHARGRRVVLYGLSLGGMTSYHVAAENPRVGAVVATTLLDLREGAARDAAASNLWMSRVVSPLGRTLPWLFDGLMLRAGAVGRLEAMSPSMSLVQALDEDRRIGGVMMPAAFYRTLSERNPAREPEQFTTPMLLVHPGDDLWTPLVLSRPFFDRIAGPRHLHVLNGGAHIPLEQPAFDELQQAVLAFLFSLEDGAPGASASLMKHTESTKMPSSVFRATQRLVFDNIAYDNSVLCLASASRRRRTHGIGVHRLCVSSSSVSSSKKGSQSPSDLPSRTRWIASGRSASSTRVSRRLR